MARRYSIQKHKAKDLEIALRFEAEELTETGLVVDESLANEITEYFKNTFDPAADSSLEQAAQAVHDFFEKQLISDPTNVYKNLVGDEYPRVRIVSVDVTGSYTATYGD